MPEPGFYAVANGYNPGIYDDWDEWKQQVHQYSRARYRKFDTYEEAVDFLGYCGVHVIDYTHNKSSDDSSNHSSYDYNTNVDITVDSIHHIVNMIGNRTSNCNQLYKVQSAKLYTDGAARNNPTGPAGAGIVLINSNGGTIITSCAEYLGTRSNNQAEYLALVLGLELATLYNVQSIKVYYDSELIVKQISGGYRVRQPALQLLHTKSMTLSHRFNTFTITHIARGGNQLADDLANIAIDDRRSDCSDYY